MGAIAARAIAATVTEASRSKSKRQLSARIGLPPRHDSPDGKDRVGTNSKQGDPNLRGLLAVGRMRYLASAAMPKWQRGVGRRTGMILKPVGFGPQQKASVRRRRQQAMPSTPFGVRVGLGREEGRLHRADDARFGALQPW
ncbi:transposase [Ensifer sp. HO-A22]|uniref:Transposase n=1 Tax=Ensifer oleiphilus TaxID=2742698 RepID=A0A7Y6UNU1_9HYPH|nr:transposase [Ensifer oleiphilus]